MKDYIEERAVELAYYIIKTKSTVRQTARCFGISKSTVHKDITERLEEINPSLASETRKVLDVNKAERHIRADWLQKRISASAYFIRMQNRRNEVCILFYKK